MRTIRRNLKKSAVALVISMSAMPNLVNAQAPSLTSVNKPKSSTNKAATKDAKTGVAALVDTILRTGDDGGIDKNLAPIIGLDKPMPAKGQDSVISKTSNGIEQRQCFVIYENVDSTEPKSDDKRPICLYIVKFKRTGLDRQTRFFRVNLDGKLEKVVLSQSKADETGKVVRGSGVKLDQDIDSPEVKKTFEAEMKFWLKDWLKKEQRAAKTSASAAVSPPATTPL